MVTTREIGRIIESRPTVEGAGVRLRRAIGFGDPSLFDPFLLLDDFRSDSPEEYLRGFPSHPHRGIETITYVWTGDVEHEDSLGNRGVISAGDVQWMTAGSGIIHQEMPKGDQVGRMHGFQLWANLPASHKMMDPRYRGVLAADIPEVVDASGAKIRVIAGIVAGVAGPVRDVVTAPEYLDVTLPAGASYSHTTPRGHTAFAYVVGGHGAFGDPSGGAAESIGDQHLVLFGDGDLLTARAGGDSVRFLLISGRPIREPVAWHGPIVMNTREELRIAYEELRLGTFIKAGRAGQ
jgi:hypothetical protein